MQTDTYNYQTVDGLSLFGQEWTSVHSIKGVVCLVHGLGEHSSRYTHVAQALTEAGYNLLAIDLRGHGRSGGKRGHAPSFEAYMQDIDYLVEDARRRYPGQPLFIYGHSLGGLLALNYILRRQPALAGVIVSAPGIRSLLLTQKVKVTLVRSLGVILPTLSLPTGLDATLLSHDPQVVHAYQHDPLVHGVTTLAMARANIEAIPWMLKHAREMRAPLLVMHGSADCLVYPEGSRELVGLVSGSVPVGASRPADVTLKIWDGAYHEIHNEPDKAQVLAYLINWLNAHLSV